MIYLCNLFVFSSIDSHLFSFSFLLTLSLSLSHFLLVYRGVVIGTNTVFDCKATPPAPSGAYQVYVALNAVSFDAAGVEYHYYPPMSVDGVAPFTGLASGGAEITVTGSGFLKIPSADLIFCRFGRACFTGEDDCVSDSLQIEYTLPVEEGVSVRTKATYIDENTVLCEAPARPLGTWEIFVSNNGQDFEPDAALGGLSSFTSRPCGEGREAFEYYDACTECRAGFFDADAERPNRIGEDTVTVYPIQCSQCPIGQYQENRASLQCDVCPLGTTTLATVDKRIVQVAAASSRENDCTCINADLSPDGVSSFYQDKITSVEEAGATCTWLTGGCCTECPEGAVCGGGNSTIFADDGYWQQLDPDGSSIEVFQKCTPASSCKRCDIDCMKSKKRCTDATIPNDLSNEGGRAMLNQSYPHCQVECQCTNFNCYTGEGCASCARDVPLPDGTPAQNFYREDGFCERCPPTDGAILAFMIVGLIVGLYFFALFAQYFRGLGAPRIWMNYMAVTVAFAKFDLNWPPEVLAFFRWFNQFYIDIDVVKPECELTLTFFESWIYMMVLPLFVLGILLTWYALTSVSSKPFGSAKDRARLADKDRRTAWLKFKNVSEAWSLVQLLRAGHHRIEVYDDLDGVTWILDPDDTIKYDGPMKRRVRLWKQDSLMNRTTLIVKKKEGEKGTETEKEQKEKHKEDKKEEEKEEEKTETIFSSKEAKDIMSHVGRGNDKETQKKQLNKTGETNAKSVKKNHTRSTKKTSKRTSVTSIIQYNLKRTPIARERLIAVESCRVNSQDVVKKPLYHATLKVPSRMLKKKDKKNTLLPRPESHLEVPVFRVTRRIRSRAVKIAGVDINSATVASRGKLLASVGEQGKVEFSRGFAFLFKLDNDVASRRKEFMIDKIKLDIDGPVSTTSCRAHLNLQVTIFRSKHGQPDFYGEPLADAKIKIKNPGVVAVDFSGAVAVSHYWHPTYWLVLKPTGAHLVGTDVKSGQWVLRHVREGVVAPTQVSWFFSLFFCVDLALLANNTFIFQVWHS